MTTLVADLMLLVPPASKSDCPGERALQKLEHELGKARVEALERAGFILVGGRSPFPPGWVLTYYEEFSSREQLWHRAAPHPQIVAISMVGWEAIRFAVSRGGKVLPAPTWVDRTALHLPSPR